MCIRDSPSARQQQQQSRRSNSSSSVNDNDENDDNKSFSSLPPSSTWKLWLFISFLLLDALATLAFLAPMLPIFRKLESPSSGKYKLYGSLWDLALLAALRIVAGLYSLTVSYWREKPAESPFQSRHANGNLKTTEELEEEALEEPCCSWFRRYVKRLAFPCEVLGLITGILVIIKCLARLNVELGIQRDVVPKHPLFWLVLCLVAVFVVLEVILVDSVSNIAGEIGRFNRQQEQEQRRQMMENIEDNNNSLTVPLLVEDSDDDDNNDNNSLRGGDVNNDNNRCEQGLDEEQAAAAANNVVQEDDNVVGVSDITSDSKYKAGWSDLLALCYQDVHLISLAFIFLLGAAVMQVLIPRFMGNILDALAHTFDKNIPENDSIWSVPGFVINVEWLVVASILGGVFSGIRGSIFTIVGGRVNVRLRIKLMDSLLAQDIGFFDTTKTGDITSRLTSDTTLVGDQVQLNVNVFLRSLVQAIGVLIFMFLISWQLSLLAFISVPVITVLSKWYGNYVRSLTKLMQKKLADGNTVSEAALGSMPTVRSFDAAESELKEFEECMSKYLQLNIRSAIAYCGYCTCVTALPQLVIALVLFYGGLLVRNQDISSGQLVSFLLYLSSLSDAFSSIGYIFSSMTQAVGAADKVFELMHRKPQLTAPSCTTNNNNVEVHTRTGFMGIETMRTTQQRSQGLQPSVCRGEVTLKDVELSYPARPQRQVLHGLTLQVPPGAVVALVGPSGSGKSSVMSLVQHLYEPSSGEVCIDGNKVHDLSPQWLSRHISVVSQEPTLFGRSIRRNIIYGLEGAPDEPSLDQVKEAARLANAASFIEKLPFGYETDVGERGVQLSGGQKQRIAIARALVRKPRILLLDEATSALDAESEALVQEAIDDMLARGRGPGDKAAASSSTSMTVLIVAHRLSTVRNADIIFVVQDGRVVEQGNHRELVEDENGAYASLIRRQMKAQKQLDDSSSSL